MACEAKSLVTVGRDRVRSVRIFKAKLRKVIKGMNYPFVRGKCIYHMIVKREVALHPRKAPERPGPKVFGLGHSIGANIK